jgi:hypothetical protein
MRGHRLGVYRKERGTYLIEIRLRELRQLFNTLDPSPFHERDLDTAAEEYLVSAAREIGARPGKLVLHLPAQSTDEDALGAVTAIRNYFGYRSRHTRQQLRLLLGRGAISLAIGLAFLGACLVLRRLLGDVHDPGGTILSEGLLILGWVAMWRPVEIFLYDWWPELGRRRLFERIAHMQIETHGSGAADLAQAASQQSAGKPLALDSA